MERKMSRIDSDLRGAQTQGGPYILYVNAFLLLAVVSLWLSDEEGIFSIFSHDLFVRDTLFDEDVLDLSMAYHLLPQEGDIIMPGRFPRLGSEDFRHQCQWTLMPAPEYNNCTVFMTPRENGHEGISYWISEVTMSYMLARMGHCQLYFDYGDSVAIDDILIPASKFVDPEDIFSPLLDDWLKPEGFECREEASCFIERFPQDFPPSGKFDQPNAILKEKAEIAPIPRYRFAFQYESGRLFRGYFQQTEKLLPGFKIATGMACSLGNLFHLSPNAAKYDNDDRLFTETLPMLRSNPVLALYIRTGRAERLHTNDTTREDDVADNARYEKMPKQDEIVKQTVETAMELEQKYLSGELELGFPGAPAKPVPRNEVSTLIWLVITDSVSVKEEILAKYNDQTIYENSRRRLDGDSNGPDQKENIISGHLIMDNGRSKSISRMKRSNAFEMHIGGTKIMKAEKTQQEKAKEWMASAKVPVNRKVLVTSARGAHTRLEKGGTTTDAFSEAVLDWYLIGESDAVIASSMYSFGMTAALRTARPIFDPAIGASGQPLRLVHEGVPNKANRKDQAVKIIDEFCARHKGFRGSIGMFGQNYELDCPIGDRRKLQNITRIGMTHRYGNFRIKPLDGTSPCHLICISKNT